MMHKVEDALNCIEELTKEKLKKFMEFGKNTCKA